ncbi:hypothetical protein TNCV_2734511 [Trichonephila clavipes]|nr:hypothetical protein TNCV_2734511 [Trichonephila clavipes]
MPQNADLPYRVTGLSLDAIEDSPCSMLNKYVVVQILCVGVVWESSPVSILDTLKEPTQQREIFVLPCPSLDSMDPVLQWTLGQGYG